MNTLKESQPKRIRDKVSRAIESKQELELSGNAKGRYTMRRNQAMKAMIVDGVWSKDLAKMYDISKEDVRVYHTEEMRISVFLNYSTHNDFRKHLFDKAVKAFEIEKLKLDKYQEGSKAKGTKGLLRKLFASNKFQRENNIPRLLIEQKLYGRNEEGKSKIEVLHDELDAYCTRTDEYGEREWLYKGREISQHEYKKGTEVVDAKLRKLQVENQKLYNLFFLDNEANDNMTYIKAVGHSILEQFVSQKEQFESDTTGLARKPLEGMLSIQVTSVGQGKKLIEKYCSWFNKKFKDEIEATKNEDEKVRTAEKNEKNRIENRTKKLDRDRQIIELRESGERNAVKIAVQVDEKERTVREILTRYDRVVELYRCGVTVPEAITEQIKTKLSTVIHYLEIFTGESINTNSLTSEQRQQQELARQQETEARKEMEEREFRRLEREKANFWKMEQEKVIIRLHSNGLYPSNIQKSVNISVTAIKNILKEHNLVPHFDWKVASDEEHKENSEKRRIQEQEVAKTRKRIDL